MSPGAAVDRRSLLKLAAAAAGGSWLPRCAWSQPRIAESPFVLGVASGSPEPESVVLWTRLVRPELAGQQVTVQWEIADDEAFTRIARGGTAQALPEFGHAVHVEAAGLAPDRWYFYRFMTSGYASRTGRTRTLPAGGAEVARWRMGYASCQRWEHGYFSAWRHLREEAPDAVVFLGDYIYEYPTAQNAVRPADGEWVTTLAQYRARHALYKSDADLQAMHAACPWFLTWDDHEVQNDYAGLTAGEAGPRVADFAARRAAAYQAYYEHMPLRAGVLARALNGAAAGGALRLHARHRIGRLADLLLLDARQYRNVQACQRPGRLGSNPVAPSKCAQWNDPNRSMLGAPQEAWLAMQLADRGATWTVLGQSTLFGRRDQRAEPDRLQWNDGWDGYAPARARLVQALQANGVANPVLLGGDVHENWVGHVLADYDRADSANVGVEFCGTSLTSRTGEAARAPERLALNPHYVHGDGSARGYGVADFAPRELRVRLQVVDDAAKQDARVSTQAAFVVAAGRPVVERA